MDSYEVDIERLAYRGAGIARKDGKTVFVHGGVPGDRVVVQETRSKKRFAEAQVVSVVRASPHRVDPPCPHFGDCGGCQWQQIDYRTQLAAKGEILAETVTRLGHMAVDTPPVIPSPKVFGYRRRVRFQVASGKLGFYGARSRRLIPIESCPILAPELNARLPELAEEALDHPDGSVSIDDSDHAAHWSAGPLSTSFPFSQANGEVNLELRTHVKSAVDGLGEPGCVLDFFCGDGNLSIDSAAEGVVVRGWDVSTSAIERAQQRSAEYRDARYRAGSVSNLVSHNFEDYPRPRIAIIDPPRQGLKAAGGFVPSLGMERVIYVSCSPPDLARDLAEFQAAGYQLTSLLALDMFPQTYHIEAIAVLDKLP